jgi:hypothetical protein
VAGTTEYAKEMVANVAAGDATTRGAARFFWIWLILATSVSVAGNVAHAVLTAPSGTMQLAAAAAVVPPAVLLGSTHSVALLVKAHRVGFNYWCALTMTIALAGCAFVLSFDALRDLAVALGMPPDRAWLWPVAIDVSIANSTLSLLSLAPPRTAPDPANRSQDSVSRESAAAARSGEPDAAPQKTTPLLQRPASPQPVVRALAGVPGANIHLDHGSAPQRFRPAADELVRSGVTSKDPAIVAAVLADHAAGTPPSTISRRHKVHHSTVGRILAGAQALTG